MSVAHAQSTLTRRHLLRSGTLAVGAVACSGALGSAARAFGPTVSLEFSAERRATLEAIIDALSSVIPDVDASRAGEVATGIAKRYVVEETAIREGIDEILDAVAEDAPQASFSRMPRPARMASLRNGVLGRQLKEERVTDDRWVARGVLIQSAIALAAQPFFDPSTSPWSFERFPLR